MATMPTPPPPGATPQQHQAFANAMAKWNIDMAAENEAKVAATRPPAHSFTPESSPAVPTSTPAPMPEVDKAAVNKDYFDKLKAGQSWADEHFKEGSLGTMSDPRQAEVNAQLAKLQLGQNGMTPEEMQAGKEQGRGEIDRQLASNLRRLGGVAAAHGVHGASGAGLMARATTDAQTASGDLQRKLVLDNLAQKNLATQAYGNALTGQQATELGIAGKNLSLRNQEALGRTATPFQISSGIDAAEATAKGDIIGKEQINLAKEGLKATTAQAAAANPNSVVETGPLAGKTDSEKAAALSHNSRFNGLNPAQKSAILNQSDTQYAQERGYATFEDMPEDMKNTPDAKAAKTDTESGIKSANSNLSPAAVEAARKGEPQQGCARGVYCYVMTVALNKGFLDEYLYNDTVTDCPIKRDQASAYGVWGPLMARMMKKSPWFAKIISWLIPGVVDIMRGRKASIKGIISYYGIYAPLNALSNLYLRIKKPHGT